jgi:hypothetical protein
MTWLTVITLPDGTTVEVPMPSSENSADYQEYRYRVRRADAVIEFATLAEVTRDLLDPEDMAQRGFRA